MSPAPADMVEFLRAQPPFDALPDAVLESAAGSLYSLYVSAANVHELLDDTPPALYVVRSAVLDIEPGASLPAQRLESGDLFGHDRLRHPARDPVVPTVVRDGIVYRLDAARFETLCARYPEFARYFGEVIEGGMLRERESRGPDAEWVERRVGELLTRAPVTAQARDSITAATQRMREAGVSCLPVLDNGALRGIVTDRDLRNRVLAAGRDPAAGLSEIMTGDPVSIAVDTALFDAIVLMSRHNIHHLPVTDAGGTLCGVLTSSDLMREQRADPVLVTGRLRRAATREALIDEARAVPALVRAFAARTGNGDRTGHLLASLTDTLTRRLIELWEAAQGAPPGRYAWLAFGSHARRDQHLHSDQDSGLVLADDVADDAWFSGLAEWVRDGLARCAIPPCPGNMMAANPDWRLTRAQWRQRFEHWTGEPSPDGVMHGMICFDSRCIAGDGALYRQHREEIAALGRNGLFLAHAARRILNLPVPLGLFDRLLTRHRAGGHGVDIKHSGIAIINDIARLHALAEGITIADTPTRLERLAAAGVLAPADSRDLADSWRLLVDLRLQRQLDPDCGDDPNLLLPERLGTLQRRQLKAAFRVVKTSQRALALRFLGGG